MIEPVAIVDLFSGPGGLGEGFSAYEFGGRRPYQIALSIESDSSAYDTLLLRSFLRKFDEAFPQEYYDFLNGYTTESNWKELYPEQWQSAENETRQLELGSPAAGDILKKEIEQLRSKHKERIVLIGGPPCQAYSLVGRARIAGMDGYMPHLDKRHYLFQQYVEVVSRLRPAIAIMENVKGMLSSKVEGVRIFEKVMNELRNAGGKNNYRLFALSPSSNGFHFGETSKPSDFVLRAEEYGVPQARHRLFVVALRSDVAEGLSSGFTLRLGRQNGKVCVSDVFDKMPKLRSGLSRGDDPVAWRAALRAACERVEKNPFLLSPDKKEAFQAGVSLARKTADCDIPLAREERGGVDLPESCPRELRDWIRDVRLERLPNNKTRGHMPADLARYLFAAVYGRSCGFSPKAANFPEALAPNHKNWKSGKFSDRFRVQLADRPSSTITSHISKDGHYFIHPDPAQCRSLTVREAARLQTFPDNYFFKGNRTQQYVQVGNAVPPFLARQIAECLWKIL